LKTTSLFGRGCVFGVALALAMVAPRRARADDIPEVKLTDSGPDRPIPAGSSFYLSGSADETTQAVQVAVVRVGYPSLWPGRAPTCTELADKLGGAPKMLGAGQTKAGKIFPAPKKYGDKPALVSATWKRPDGATGKQDFKILVDGDDRFFSPGHRFCLFLVQDAQKVDAKTVPNLLAKAGDDIAACKDEPTCVRNKLKEVCQGLKKAVGKDDKLATCDKPGKADAPDSVDKALAAATQFADRAQKIAQTSRLLTPEPVAPDPASSGAPPSAWRQFNVDHLASVLAVRLTGVKGGLLAVVVPPTATVATVATIAPLLRLFHLSDAGLIGANDLAHIDHYTGDASVDATYLQVLDDRTTIRVASSAAPKTKDAAQILGAKTSDVMLGDDAALHDFLFLGDRKVQAETKVLTFQAVADLVHTLPLNKDWSSGDTDRVNAIGAKLAAMSDAVQAAIDSVTKVCPDYAKDPTKNLAGCADKVGGPDGDAWVAYHLLGWLTERGLKIEASDERPRPTELASLANDFYHLVSAKGAFAAEGKNLVLTSEKVTATRVATMQIRFDQKAWVFSYLTPVVGYAELHDSFAVFYTGIQLHLWPNPVNDPLWSNGYKDLRRAFAFEAGIAPQTGSFGPDGRYTAADGIPPLFLGLALHPIPYTSVTIGKVRLGRRNSALPAEKPRTTWEWFVGFNVQVNVPDLIRQVSSPTADTSVAKQ
jgi:hypothetical protein